MDGIVNIDKPLGWTSFSVVARIRKLFGERRVGHAGTLDPLATGVLPILIGKATRLTEYLHEQRKCYVAYIRFGFTSTSGDADGEIVETGDASGLDADRVSLALTSFKGDILQIPPMHSALKYKGRPLYELAREGITVDRPSRTVTIHAIELQSWENPLASIRVECSRGTYIRTLAHDLGAVLGCGAYLSGLRRVSYGPFDLGGSVNMDRLEEAALSGELEQFVHPLDEGVLHLPSLTLSDELNESFRHGKPLSSTLVGVSGGDGNRCRAYGLDGNFLGVLRFNTEKDEWQPEKVFS